MGNFRECILCKNRENIQPYCSIEGYDYMKCGVCGLIYLNEIPDFHSMYRAYDGGFWKSTRRKLVLPFRSFSAVKNFSASVERAEKIMSFADSKRLTKGAAPKFLDVGCNKGFLLASAIKRGYDVYGIEFVPELVVPFKRKYRKFSGNIYTGRFSTNYHRFPEEMLDMVTAIDVIEHFEDPLQDVIKIFEMLKKDGLFIFRTPDSDGQQAKKAGCEWGALKPLEHLYLFNKTNIVKFMKDVGFEKIDFFDPIEEGEGNFIAVAKK